MNAKKAKLWGLLSSIAVMAYITFGAGYEIFKAMKVHKVGATVPFISLSAGIFICRFFYGYYSGARRTMTVDLYGFIVMLCLLITKLIAESS